MDGSEHPAWVEEEEAEEAKRPRASFDVIWQSPGTRINVPGTRKDLTSNVPGSQRNQFPMVSNAQRMHESLTNVEALWVEKDTISNLEE